MSDVVLPDVTVALVGVIDPPAPAVAVTVYWVGGDGALGANVALTVQLAVTGPVV
ncbi:MAG: hypothetical protein M0038_15535 [Pseudomonadota bacterium]|nr:hypothetical protein [Pseudomonadota bacterium]